MDLFSIDRDKCKRDGHCVAECPAVIIEMKDKESFPSPVGGAAELCINCGHCVSVCPHGAISLNTMKPEDCPPIRKDLLLTPEQAEHFLRARRSLRTYKDKPVDPATLTRLIDIARYAPSGHNFQPVHWLIIDGRTEMKRLASIVIDWMRVMIPDHPDVAEPMHFDRAVKVWENGQDSDTTRCAPSDRGSRTEGLSTCSDSMHNSSHISGTGRVLAGARSLLGRLFQCRC